MKTMDMAFAETAAGKRVWIVRAICLAACGLVMAGAGSQDWLATGLSRMTWFGNLLTVVPTIATCLIVDWSEADAGRARSQIRFHFAIIMGVLLVAVMAPHPWKAGVYGIFFAGMFLEAGWVRRRAYHLALTGWYLAGLAATAFSV
jgi:hypothetical protein